MRQLIKDSLGNASWWLVAGISIGLAIVLVLVTGLPGITHGVKVAGGLGAAIGCLGMTAFEAMNVEGGTATGLKNAFASPWWYAELVVLAGMGVAVTLPIAFLGAVVCSAAGAFLGALGATVAENRRLGK